MITRQHPLSAAIVPYTTPRYVTSVTRLNSSGVISLKGENTDVMASFTHTSMGPNIFLDLRGCGVDRTGVGHVGRKHQRTAAARFHIPPRRIQSIMTARDEPDVCTSPRKRARRRPAYAGGRSGDDDDFGALRASGVAAPPRSGYRGILGCAR